MKIENFTINTRRVQCCEHVISTVQKIYPGLLAEEETRAHVKTQNDSFFVHFVDCAAFMCFVGFASTFL